MRYQLFKNRLMSPGTTGNNDNAGPFDCLFNIRCDHVNKSLAGALEAVPVVLHAIQKNACFLQICQ